MFPARLRLQLRRRARALPAVEMDRPVGQGRGSLLQLCGLLAVLTGAAPERVSAQALGTMQVRANVLRASVTWTGLREAAATVRLFLGCSTDPGVTDSLPASFPVTATPPAGIPAGRSATLMVGAPTSSPASDRALGIRDAAGIPGRAELPLLMSGFFGRRSGLVHTRVRMAGTADGGRRLLVTIHHLHN